MRLLFSADWHINLHKKKIPYDWQYARYEQMFQKMLELENTHDIIIIGGDLFDRAPHSDEIALLLSYLNRTKKPIRIIPGNHESTNKGASFLEDFEREWVLPNPNVKVFTKNSREIIEGVGFQFFPYGEMEIDNLPVCHEDDILITHIRGDAPPHIKAEYDFEKLKTWRLVLLGDLHFYHQYQNKPIYYPGSPLNTSFDRNDTKSHGVLSINTDTLRVEFIDLKLPKLLRKTIDNQEEIKADDFNHIIYEIKGNIKELSKVSDNALIDKKIINKAKEDTKINLHGLTIFEELDKYLDYIKITNKQAIVDEFKGLGIYGKN